MSERMTELRFFVPGRPLAKERPRFGRGRAYPAPQTVAWEQAWKWYALRALPAGFIPFNGPVRLQIDFRFAKPKKGRAGETWHTVKPDWDNLAKMIDALKIPKNSKDLWPGAWVDDARVCDARITKRWSDDEHPEGTTVLITEIA